MIQTDNTFLNPDLDSAEIFLGRNPIFDSSGAIVAYELLFKSKEGVDNPFISDDLAASSNVIINAMSHFGLESVLGDHDGFLRVSSKLITSNTMDLLPPKRIILDVIDWAFFDQEVIKRLHELKKKGFRLALSSAQGLTPADTIFQLLDFVKVNLSLIGTDRPSDAAGQNYERALEDFTKEIRERSQNISIIASQIQSEIEFNLCKNLKLNLFQGEYFSQPTILKGRKPRAEQISLIQVIGLLFKDSDISEIELHFKNSPDLTLGLLRLVNSVGIGGHMKISSVRQALVVLGQKQLLQWLLLLAYTQAGSKLSSNLQLKVVNRAKFLELLSQHESMGKPSLADQAFIVGMLSLIEQVCDLSLEEILKQIPLAEQLQKSLLYRDGIFGELLNLVEAVEVVNFDRMEDISNVLGMSAEFITKTQIEAMQWSNELNKQISRAKI